MKSTRSLLLLAALSPAALLLPGCAKPVDVQPAAPSPQAAAKNLVADIKATASDSWDSIKDYAYEKRDDFAASLDRMALKRDTDIRALNAKLTGLPDAVAKERDRASKEFNDALTALKSQLADLRTGTADTWADAKGKAAQAWQRVQAAFDKVKSSPTS